MHEKYVRSAVGIERKGVQSKHGSEGAKPKISYLKTSFKGLLGVRECGHLRVKEGTSGKRNKCTSTQKRKLEVLHS